VESGGWKNDSTFGLPPSTHGSSTLIKKRKPSVIGLVLNPSRKGSNDHRRQHAKNNLELLTEGGRSWWQKIRDILRNHNGSIRTDGSKKILVSASHYIGNLFHARDFLPELCNILQVEAACFSFAEVPDKGKLRWLNSLSCPCLLGSQHLQGFWTEAEKKAAHLMDSIKKPDDLIAYREEGVPLGILVHDHYLRKRCVAQASLSDPALAEDLKRGISIYLATKNFFTHFPTALVWADHPVYLNSGVVLQTAALHGIPCIQISGSTSPIICPIYPPARGLPKHRVKMAYHVPYEEFPILFKKMSRPKRVQALIRARRAMHRHMKGMKREIVAGGYSPLSLKRRESEGEIGTVHGLVLPRDFSDAPNVYGKMLFPDNYSWLQFVLAEAQKTKWSWALKPHPNRWGGDGEKMDRLNHSVLEKVRAQFPHVRFLDPQTSYRELIQKGLKTVFTPCGSVGHELPALGVAVVNAGLNPHISYDFNYHPASRKELVGFIRRAGRLKAKKISKLPEFYYMRYNYLSDKYSIKNLWPKKLEQWLSRGELHPEKIRVQDISREFPSDRIVTGKIRTFIKGKFHANLLADHLTI